MDPGNLSAVISASAGLLGVVVANIVVVGKEWALTRDKRSKETAYLAVLVGSHLERFANGCLDVANDDGCDYGQPAGQDGELAPTVKKPIFTPLEIDVDWKVLPKELMFDIFQIADRQELIQRQLRSLANFPEDSDYWWVRREDYAKLGLHVTTLIERLAEHSSIPTPDREISRARAEGCEDVVRLIAAQKIKYEARVAARQAQRKEVESMVAAAAVEAGLKS